MRKPMFNPNAINPFWIKGIKILSPIVIIGAMLVDGAIAYQWIQGYAIPKIYSVIGIIGSVALVAHALEGLVAGLIARRKKVNALKYGVYTFLVGTLAVIDIINRNVEG